MQRSLEALQTGTFDVLVLGGGMQGAWVALRAVEAGYRVALVERDDFGGATSANSLNILHGGLRYLQQLDFPRMRDSIRARREFALRSPHLFQPLSCLMPLNSVGIRSPWILGPALKANDIVAADRNRGVTVGQRLGAGRLMGRKASVELLAPLVETRPASSALWWDALAADSARLCLEPVLTVARSGAVVANHLEAVSYLLRAGTVTGVVVRDRLDSREFEVEARIVVNACGPWAGHLSEAAGLRTDFMPPAWVGGLNVVLRRSLGIDTAVALSSATKAADESALLRRATRELFFVPWRGVTMVGTDYHVLAEAAAGHAGPPLGAVPEFVAEIARVAPRAELREDDVALVHWGVLPMDSPSARLPRKSAVMVSGRREAGADGLVVVIGEKLTSGPVLSSKVLRRISQAIGTAGKPQRLPVEREPRSETAPAVRDVTDTGRAVVERLEQRYGRFWPAVAAHAVGRPELLAPILPGADILGVEVVHGIREEMAMTLDDLARRRLGLCQAEAPDRETLLAVARVAAGEPLWRHGDAESEVERLVSRYNHVSTEPASAPR